MSVIDYSFTGTTPAGDSAQDAEIIAATLLLNEVKAFLLKGQPRQAVAHICDVTGVGREQASNFVAKFQNTVFG
jgi:hypothetical protein